MVKYYVCLDKKTKEPMGVTSGEFESPCLLDQFDTILVSAEYSGKQGYKLKYDNNKLRDATKSEIDAYIEKRKKESEVLP